MIDVTLKVATILSFSVMFGLIFVLTYVMIIKAKDLNEERKWERKLREEIKRSIDVAWKERMMNYDNERKHNKR